jgi:hypothetical protein
MYIELENKERIMIYTVYQFDNKDFFKDGQYISKDHADKLFNITFFGKVDGNDLFMYRPVAAISANDLDEVFQIGNIGPADQIEVFDKMKSISIGDIICDQDGNYMVVGQEGFHNLPQVGEAA